jgi:hypothetical protein
MANALGRISGQLLKDNLTREGRELAFDTDLLFLNVGDRRIGANTDVPTKPLEINGTTTTTNLIVDELLDTIKLGTQVRISGSTLTSLTDNLNLTASNYVFGDNVRTSKLDFNNNVISSLATDTKIEIRPNQTGVDPLLFGSLEIYSNLNITGDLYTPYNITLDGNITFGSDSNDTIEFGADVDSDIIPDQNEIYRLGSIGQKWEGLYTELINGEQVTSSSIASGGIDLALLQGKIWYVATNGSDIPNPELTQGKHQNAPFASIGQALSQAAAGDTVYIYPGTYTEIFPLTVPVGVTVKGTGIRSVTVKPTVLTESNNAFLLNGESTISDLSVVDFYAPGYAFSFAPAFTVSTRSPYVQNITVITKGSVTSLADPRGFDQGDAGGGARVDGSLATSSSKEASMLFHSVTFITPGVDALVMTNGVRVEWLNSFSYFANRGLYATQGTLGLASLGIRFGAEIRSIGSANVYGNYGAEANGASTLMYLIQHNFAYIGAGKDVTNDSSLNIAANETVELAAGKIYYQSLDNKGNFKVGDAFGVSFDTGRVTINGVSVSAGGVSSINFASGTDETVIDAEQVTTGNVTFSNNLLTTLSGALNLDSGTDEIKLNANTSVSNNLDILGNLNTDGTLTIGNAYIDVVRFEAPVEFDLRPKTDDDYTLGGPTNKRWDFVYLDTSYIGSYKLENATISTVPTDADIELRADGTGRIFVNQDNVEFDQDLTVDGTTNLGDNVATLAATVTGTIDHTGLLDRTGDTDQTGTYDQDGYLDVSSNVQIANVTFIDNIISTVTLGTNLELGAASTGKVTVPSADVQIDNNLFVTGNIQVDSIGITTGITTDSYSNGNIEISLDLITTTLTDSNLEFRAAGTGKVYASQDSVKFDQDLTVNETTALRTTNITGTLTQYGDYLQTGDTLQTGNRNISLTLEVDSDAYFDSMSFVGNTITTTDADTDLQLKAVSTGIVDINDNVTIDQNLRINSTTYTNGITNSSTTESDTFSDNDIEISTNVIKTTVGSNNLRLLAAGTGIISVPNDAVEFNQDLTVDGTTNLKNTVIGSSALTSSLSFASSNYLSLSAAQTIGTQSYTFECFFYTASNGLQTILGASATGGMSIWLLGDGINPVTIIQIDRSNIDAAQYTVSPITLNTWHHLAVTRDSLNNASVFLDGVKATGSASNTANYTASSGLIGAVAGSAYFFTGYLTQIKLAVGSNYYDPTAASISVPTAPLTTSANTKLLLIVANSSAYITDTSGTQTVSNIGGVTYSATGPSTSNVTHVGNYLQTGNTVQTGNRTITGTLDVTNNVYFDNINIVDNRIFTTNSNDNLELKAAGSGIVQFNDNLRIVNALTVGTLTANGIGNSGTVASDIFTNNNINIVDNKISTIVTDANIVLSSNGSGNVKTVLTNVVIDQTLDVADTTNLKNISISGLLDVTGDYTQIGVYTQTGNRDVSAELTVTNNVYFDNINIVDNRIFTTNSNDDLELRAVGTGIVVFNDNTQFSQAALFGTLESNGLTNSGTITSDIFTDGDIEIYDNYITTTTGNNDLRLVPNGTGKVSLPLDPVVITQDLTVEDDAILSNTTINGDLDHLGNTVQTGNVVQTGNFDLSTDLTVTGTDAFFTDIRIINNRIATSTGNNNLELRADGTAIIKIADSATFGQTLTVNGTTTTSTISATTGTITSDIFSDSDIEINDNYITTTVGNNNLILAGSTTGGPKLEKIKFNSNTISTETINEGITLTVPSGSVVISASTALKVPVGTTADRPTLTQGEFRFNTTDNLFRGYSTSTVSFAGVYSADRRTSVLAHPTNNTLLFTTNTLNNMSISSTGLTVNSFTVDNNTTFATNIISTAVTNNDLYLTPNGTGKVVMDNISVGIDEISNSANAALVIQNTGNGYVRFGGTGGIALPSGPTVVDTTGVELGDLRYNTDLSIPEIFNGVDYVGFVSENAALLSAAEVQEITNLWALVIG